MKPHFWAEHHAKVVARRKHITSIGKAEIVTSMQSSQHDTRIEVAVPYHPDWRIAAGEMWGRWRPRTHCWTFKASYAREVCNAIVRIYGHNVLPASWESFRLEENAKQIAAMKQKLLSRREG